MKQRFWLILGMLGLMMVVLLLLNYQAQADFNHTSDVLLSSESEPCSAVKPRLATSSDKHWLAVAWVQEDEKSGGGCHANAGRAILRWATEETSPSGWQGPLAVFDTSNGCINHVDVALDGATAHIVATIQKPCVDTTNSSLLYRTCNLTTGECTAEIEVYRETNPQLHLLEAYITLDQYGRPHIVYGRREIADDELTAVSEVRYTRQGSGGTWKHIRLSGESERAYRPTITWSYSPTDAQGYVHFAWETHEALSSGQLEGSINGRTHYRRCPDDAETVAGAINCNNNPDQMGLPDKTHSRPALAVSGDRVILVWNRCDDVDTNPPCEKFNLLYRRSETTGWGFSEPIDAISEQDPAYGNLIKYEGTDYESLEYEASLHPALTVNNAGLPVIAWQVKKHGIEGGYTLTTTWVYSQTTSRLYWEDTGWAEGNGYDTRVAASISVPDPIAEPQGLHLVFMQREGLYTPYRIYYSYFGDTQYVTPTPTATPIPEEGLSIYLPLVARNHH